MSTPPRIPDLGDRAARTLLQNFDALDADRDGAIEPHEVNSALIDTRVRGAVADAAVAVKTTIYDRMVRRETWRASTSTTNGAILGPLLGPLADEGMRRAGITPSGRLTRQDLQDLANNPRRQADSNELDGAMNRSARRRAMTPNRNQVFRTGAISVHQVGQTNIGDCYYLAAVASYAHMRAAELRGRIRPNRDGGATIRFGRDTRITVAPPTDGELGYGATSRGGGTWVTLMEKAYGRLRNDQAWFTRTTVPVDAADGGGLASRGIRDLTGNRVQFHLTRLMTLDGIRRNLREGVANRRLMVAGTPGGNGTPRTAGGHAYSVLGYDARTDIVTLRNPWGHNGDRRAQGVSGDGFVRMTVAQFRSEFYALAIEEGTLPAAKPRPRRVS